MCAPKAPKVEPIPQRQAARLPDNGDPLVREGERRRRTALRMMIFGGATSKLGAASVSRAGGGQLGTTGGF
jgi:hypothetical protein